MPRSTSLTSSINAPRSGARGFITALVLGSALLGCSASALAKDARTAIERAVRQIELGDYTLARSHLELPLIDGRITSGERSRAYYLQGYSLEQQKFVIAAGQNYAKALEFNPDNPATLAALGYLYMDGRGVEQDYAKAAVLLRRSAELGHGPGMTGLGALLLANLRSSAHPSDDLAEARRWLTSATEAQSPTFRTAGKDAGKAFLFLAQSYRAASSCEPDPEQAMAYYQEALLLNEPEAFNSIGHMHLNGELGEPDISAALVAFERGAENASVAAQVSLGYLHLTGNGVPTNRTKARELLNIAAEAGDLRAHHYLGYLNETAEPANTQAAIANYTAAARGHHLPALIRLSELAFVSDQPDKGIGFLRRAASSGDVNANNQLAWLLATSRNDALRDGAAAVVYAKVAVATQKTPATLDTLAAAYAENNQFDAAVRTQAKALALLQTTPQQTTQQSSFVSRLAAYERGEAWRAPISN